MTFAAVPNLIGQIVRTSYGSGPYRVIEQRATPVRRYPCCWREVASPGHYSFVCVDADAPVRRYYRDSELYWLNYWTWDGMQWSSTPAKCPTRPEPEGTVTCVDTLSIEGLIAVGQQMAMELTA